MENFSKTIMTPVVRNESGSSGLQSRIPTDLTALTLNFEKKKNTRSNDSRMSTIKHLNTDTRKAYIKFQSR